MNFYITAICFTILAFVFGCTPPSKARKTKNEFAHKAFKQGQEYVATHQAQKALKAFETVLAECQRVSATHLELGRLYLEDFEDPIRAIYHFEQFLATGDPDSQKGRIAAQMIETAKKDFLARLPVLSAQIRSLKEEYGERIARLEKENALLQKQIALYKRAPSEDTLKGESKRPVSSSIQAVESRSYTVKPGDTLSSISEKVYGHSRYWKHLYEGNRDKLSTPTALKVGSVIAVPPLPKSY